MSENWKTYKIEDLGTVITGKTPSSKNPHHYGNYIPFVTPSDFDKYHKNVRTAERYLSPEGMKTLKNKVLPQNSVLVTCIGSQMGKVVINRVKVITNQQLNSIIPNELVDPDYLYYRLSTMREELRLMAGSGSTMPMLNKTDFGNIKNAVPPIDEQRAIASILSALDDKIELNLQMNKTLEEMASALYKHWFVDFGPFREGKFVESELGMIPEGWKVKSIGDFADILNSQRVPLSTKERSTKKGPYPYYGASGIIDSIDDYKFDGEYVIVSEDGENLRSRNTPVAFRAVGQFWVNNHAHILKGKRDGINEMIICHFSQLDLNPFITGAVQPKLNKQNLLLVKLPVPLNEAILDEVFKQFYSLSRIVISNNSENQTLTSLRDTLLPKLISGEVRVKEAEKILTEAL